MDISLRFPTDSFSSRFSFDQLWSWPVRPIWNNCFLFQLAGIGGQLFIYEHPVQEANESEGSENVMIEINSLFT